MEIQEFKHYFMMNNVKVHWNFKLLPKDFEAITLFGHVFDTHNKEDLRAYLETYWGRVMVNHERIHMMQAKLLICLFNFIAYYKHLINNIIG